MNLSDGINGSATAWMVCQPRTSGVNQREGLQPTPAPSLFAGVIEGCSTLRVGYSDLSPSSTLL